MSSRSWLGVRAGGRRTVSLPCLAWIVAVLSTAAVPAQEPHRLLETGGLSAETAALLMSGQEGGPIPIYAIAVPAVAREGAKAPVEIFVEAEGGALLAGHEEDRLRLELCLYALAGSRVAASRLETVELVLARDRQALLAGGVQLHATLELAAGDYRLRALVRNAQTGSVGLRTLAVSVPAADGGGDVVQLLVPAAPAGGLRLSRGGGATAIGFWPSARPVLEPGRDTDLQVLVRGLEPDSAELEIIGDRDQRIEVPAAISPAEQPAPPGLGRWPVRSHIPHLEPGAYQLRLRVADVATSPAIAVVVAPSGGEDQARPTREPIGVAAGRTPAGTDLGRPSRRAAKALTKELEQDYQTSLALLAAADTLGALAALQRMELRALEHPRGLEVAAAAEERIATALAETEESCLTPLLELHYRSYARYLSGGQFRLSGHARVRLLALVDLYLAQRPEDNSAAVEILVAMASRLQQSQVARFSSVIFHRALELDPLNENALLGLAAGLEKHGEYREAIGFLDRLVAAHPENREAWLRLGVNLGRSGSRVKARRTLTRVVDSPPADWILAVAYHQLVRDLLQRDRLEEAQTLLEAAHTRLPEDDQLQLLSSVAADSRRNGEANSGDELVLRSRADESSARHRYQLWPQLVRGGGESPTRQSLEALAAALRGLRAEA